MLFTALNFRKSGSQFSPYPHWNEASWWVKLHEALKHSFKLCQNHERLTKKKLAFFRCNVVGFVVVLKVITAFLFNIFQFLLQPKRAHSSEKDMRLSMMSRSDVIYVFERKAIRHLFWCHLIGVSISVFPTLSTGRQGSKHQKIYVRLLSSVSEIQLHQ